MPAASAWNLPRVAGEGADSEAILMLSALRHYPEDRAANMLTASALPNAVGAIVLKNGTALDLAADREIEGFGKSRAARAVHSALDRARR